MPFPTSLPWARWRCLALVSLCITHPMAWAQLAPSGYSGALNTPTADTLPTGIAELALSNSIPEKARFYPGKGGFGGINLGFGVLPGLELVGRLSFDGSLQCNGYLPDCRSWTRDLSMGGKWQLPLTLPLDSRIALGVTDVGGAATNFRQSYVVLTSQPQHSPLALSLGKATGSSPYSLMNGMFGSVSAQLLPGVQAVLENDSRETRAGLKGQLALHPRVSLVWAGSRKLTRASAQQSEQLTLGLQFALERPVNRQAAEREAAFQAFYPAQPAPIVEVRPAPALSTEAQTAHTAAPALSPPVDRGETQALAADLSKKLAAAGFADISIGLDPAQASPPHWLIQAEPLSWRKSRHEALGKVLRVWLGQQPQAQERLTVVLTYLKQASLAVRSSAQCLDDFRQGQAQCESGAALELLAQPGQAIPAQAQWLQREVNSSWLKPRLAFAPAMSYAVGTEYGLADYALALDTGWEVPLARGLVWQGFHTTPLDKSGDYGPGKVFEASRQPRVVQTHLLSYVAQPLDRVWMQASKGYITPDDKGSQLDLRWLPGDGRLRLSTTLARYQREQLGYTVQPQVVQARWSMVPGRWAVDLTAGRFFMHDQGFRISSVHWFDDYRLSFYYRQSESPGGIRMALTKFAGFSLSIPLGVRESASVGPLNIRFKDQWALGLETKVGAKDNYLTGGYGALPSPRHGMNDVTDFDRSGLADFWAQRHRIRSAMN